MISLLYSFLFYPLLLAVFFILSFKDKKIREGFNIRKNNSWLKPDFNSSNLPVYWFHVASGELEYAKPVMRELKKARPCKIIVTFFSPSVISSLKNTPEVDVFIPSPWDTPWHWKDFLDKYKPSILAISRTDLWPQMIWQANKKNIPSLLFSATLPSHSGRVASFWGRIFYSFILESLTYVSCVDEEDKNNFLRILPKLNISVDGDSRFDQVFYRLESTPPPPTFNELKKWKGDELAFIAGSTWPEDEEIIIPALSDLIAKNIKIIIAPHEVDPKHLSTISQKLNRLSLQFCFLSKLNNSPILIVDCVGILASLYTLSDVALVGGSFKKSVHSVMEPAAAGCYTLVGPFHYNSREALLLKAKGYLKEILFSKDISNIFESNLPSKESVTTFVKAQKGVSLILSQKLYELSVK